MHPPGQVAWLRAAAVLDVPGDDLSHPWRSPAHLISRFGMLALRKSVFSLFLAAGLAAGILCPLSAPASGAARQSGCRHHQSPSQTPRCCVVSHNQQILPTPIYRPLSIGAAFVAAEMRGFAAGVETAGRFSEVHPSDSPPRHNQPLRI